MALAASKSNGNGRVLSVQSQMTPPADPQFPEASIEAKPTYEDLLALVAKQQEMLASAAKGRSPTFTKSAKNPNYWIFTHNLGTKGVYPWVGTTKEVWLLILNNADVIRAALK
jgi:hypothetical protein